MSFELQQTRYDQLVRRMGNIIGPGAKVAEVLPELFPVIDVERVPGELLALGGTRLAMGSEQQLAVVAEFANVQLFNPADSGQLVTLSSAIISSDATSGARWQVVTTALPVLSTNHAFRDSRFTGTTRPVGEIRTDSTVGAVVRTGQMFTAANRPILMEQDDAIAVLAPGTGITFQTIVANNTFRVSFFWRERVALQSELNF